MSAVLSGLDTLRINLAVADYDAVVSGDIYVFATQSDRLMPELLPFLCMSERFFKYPSTQHDDLV